MSIREGDRRHHAQDKPYLFRSYDHVKAPPVQYNQFDANELNPGTVQDNATTIWEACRATSAAPLYFNKMTIRGVRYMNGGVGANNPAPFALNEAKQMASRNHNTDSKGKPAALISVGTGDKKQQQSRFRNILGVLTWARKMITDTQVNHERTQDICKDMDIPYYRFDVQEGLSKMKLDECRRKRKAREPKKDKKGKGRAANNTAVQENGNTGAPAPGAGSATNGKLFPTWQPDRYEYPTYEHIRKHTVKYCQHRGGSYASTVDVDAELTKAAELLVFYRRKREESNPKA